jgi:hypothetical protein
MKLVQKKDSRLLDAISIIAFVIISIIGLVFIVSLAYTLFTR